MVSVAVRARHLHVIGGGFEPRREPACLRGQRPNPQNYWWSYPKGFADGCPEVSSSVLRLQKCIMACLSVLFLRFYSQNIFFEHQLVLDIELAITVTDEAPPFTRI